MTTGATGLATGVLDTRVPGAGTLPNGPFVLQGTNLNDDDYTGDMTHRFYQAWQQPDCSLANATKANPTGCLNDLFPFVMATYSASNKSARQRDGLLQCRAGAGVAAEGLADRVHHQRQFPSVVHGRHRRQSLHARHRRCRLLERRATAIPITPPSNIANPNPKSGTVNQYTADNNFSNCSDVFQPGVGPIVDYIESLPYAAQPNCQPNHYYMLNNTNPGFLPNGALANGSSIPAVVRADDRRCAERQEDQLGLLRRRLQ